MSTAIVMHFTAAASAIVDPFCMTNMHCQNENLSQTTSNNNWFIVCVRCVYFCCNCWFFFRCRGACHIHSNEYPSEISAHIKLKSQQLCATVRAVESNNSSRAINGPTSNLEYGTGVVLAAATASSFHKLTNYKLECDLIFDFVREAIDQAWMQNAMSCNNTEWTYTRGDPHTHTYTIHMDGVQMTSSAIKHQDRTNMLLQQCRTLCWYVRGETWCASACHICVNCASFQFSFSVAVHVYMA